MCDFLWLPEALEGLQAPLSKEKTLGKDEVRRGYFEELEQLRL